jgi:hypothetical protein
MPPSTSLSLKISSGAVAGPVERGAPAYRLWPGLSVGKYIEVEKVSVPFRAALAPGGAVPRPRSAARDRGLAAAFA